MPIESENGVKIEHLTDEIQFGEGPVWSSALNALLFSDVHGAKIYKWSEQTGLTVWWNEGKKPNGLALTPDGQTLIVCCYSERELISINVVSKRWKTLADQFDGRPFNNVNDVALDAEGNIFFTDPRWGARPDDLQGIYCLPSSGTLRLAARLDHQPNGVALSPDQQWLFVARSGAHDIWRFRRIPGGRLTDGARWATLEPGAEPDGMTIDSRGNLYVAQAGNNKLAVIGADGTVQRLIPLPCPFPTNCAFQGGTNDTRLFVTHGGRPGRHPGALLRLTFDR
ncbi:MAG: SMP-30/gluconolactonase/LRE family protein [Candidatus Sumerlaeia bacterium]